MLKHGELTSKIIKTFFGVYNELGYGFLASVYEKAMLLALARVGLKVESQVPIEVYFRGKSVGKYFADILVNDCIILELKAVSEFNEAHELQLVNYLKATNIEVGLLLNFGDAPEFKRKMWLNTPKSPNRS